MATSVAALAFSWLLYAAPALASFELVKTFGATGEGPFEEGKVNDAPGGIAVDEATGNVYEADRNQTRVLEFDAQGKFLAAWGWGVGDGAIEYERCGPAGEAAHPLCEDEGRGRGLPGEGAGQFEGASAIAIDQTTGNVYIEDSSRRTGVVQEFTGTGTFITSFGNRGGSTQEDIQSDVGLTVDRSGVLYLADRGERAGPRVMKFAPLSPGDFTAYGFAGELFHGTASFGVAGISVDSAGDIYLADATHIFKYGAPDFSAPTWEHVYHDVEAMTSAPSGDVFFYEGGRANTFRELNGAGAQIDQFTGALGQEGADGSTFNEGHAFEPGRGAGTFYAATELNQVTKATQKLLIYSPSPEFPPKVESEHPGEVGTTYAVVGATIDPNGFDTTFSVRYGTEGPCSFASCAEVSGDDLGSGLIAVNVSLTLTALLPDTTYYFEVVASNRFGSETDGGGALHTRPPEAPVLADGRAYELVSPVEKHGGEVFPINPAITSCGECEPGSTNVATPKEAATDGEAVVYEGFPFAASGGAVAENEYIAKRSSSGWDTTAISPELANRQGGGYRAFSRDLSSGLLAQGEPVLTPDAPAGGYEDFYLRGSGGELQSLLSEPPPHRGVNGEQAFKLEYGGASQALDRVVFQANDALTEATATAPQAPEVTPSQRDVYEWSGGHLALVNVLPGNAVAQPGAVLGAGEGLKSATESSPDFAHAVSSDGTRIFWSNEATGQVYQRQNGSATITIPDTGRFLTASADGTKVLLFDGHLVDVDSANTTDLTAGHGGFLGILGASETLSRVYFVDSAVLGGENATGQLPSVGEPNLYEFNTDSDATRFIATLAPTDNANEVDGITGDWEASPSNRTANVTPDGGYLAFMSVARLTEYDHPGTPEVYEYSSQTGELICASCDPTGARPTGGGRLAIAGRGLAQPRYLAEDGRLYFDSFDTLSALDVKPGLENVYEFERDGQGSCSRPAGCVNLLSLGRGRYESSFLSMSASGRDVFFTTREQLVHADHDELVDLYDAREGGGFPEATSSVPCWGESCKDAASLPPQTLTAGSANLQGTQVAPLMHRKKAHHHHKGKHKKPKSHRSRHAQHRRGREE